MNTHAFLAVLRRDLTLAMRRKSEVLTAVFFFVVVAALFPLGIGPEMNTLRLVAPGILWVGALLASMLSLGRMFAADHADGTLEQMALSPNSLSMLVAAKILAHWLLSGLPPCTSSSHQPAARRRCIHRHCRRYQRWPAVAGCLGRRRGTGSATCRRRHSG